MEAEAGVGAEAGAESGAEAGAEAGAAAGAGLAVRTDSGGDAALPTSISRDSSSDCGGEITVRHQPSSSMINTIIMIWDWNKIVFCVNIYYKFKNKSTIHLLNMYDFLGGKKSFFFKFQVLKSVLFIFYKFLKVYKKFFTKT